MEMISANPTTTFPYRRNPSPPVTAKANKASVTIAGTVPANTKSFTPRRLSVPKKHLKAKEADSGMYIIQKQRANSRAS